MQKVYREATCKVCGKPGYEREISDHEPIVFFTHSKIPWPLHNFVPKKETIHTHDNHEYERKYLVHDDDRFIVVCKVCGEKSL